MTRFQFKHLFILLGAVTVLQVAYVNCSRPTFFESTQSQMAASSGGDGYSGKLYVTVNEGGACTDGNPYRAQIEVTAGLAYLVREACAPVTPKLVDVLISSVDSNVLSYGTQAFQENSSIGVVPQAPTVLAAMGMASSVSANHVCLGADCWKFENNGALARSVDFSTSTDYDFTVLARADLASGVGATMELRIDGSTAASQTVSSTTDAEYAFRVTVPAGRHEVALVYTNDVQDSASGIDRNLYVSSIRIEFVASTASACLSRVTGPALTLTTADLPYLNKSLAQSTRVDATAVNYSGTSSSPIRLGGGADSCMAGARMTGTWPLSSSWSTVSSTWAMGIFGPNFLLENLRVDNFGDCVAIWDNSSGFNVRGAYCSQIRGDFIANKNGWGGAIEDSLFDGGSTFFNDKDLAAAPAGAVTTIRGNLVRLQSFDQNYWGIPGHGWFWKQDPTASAVKLSLHGNVFMATEAPVTSSEWLDPSTVSSCKKADGSPDNIIVWLGAGPYPRVEELNTGCFTLSTDRKVWDDAVASWKTRHGY